MDPDVLALLAAVDSGQVGTFRRTKRNECLVTAASLIQGSVSVRVATLRDRIARLYRCRGRHASLAGSVDYWITEADCWSSVDLGDRLVARDYFVCSFPRRNFQSLPRYSSYRSASGAPRMTFDEAQLEGMDSHDAEAYARQVWDSSAATRAEFESFEACSAYCRAIARGSVRRLAS